MDAVEIAARYTEREKERRERLDNMMAQGPAGEQSDLAKRALLPREKEDPGLWAVKCKIGKEQNLVMTLMNKALTYRDEGKDPGITSAVYTGIKVGTARIFIINSLFRL